jgi:hypothetical protein
MSPPRTHGPTGIHGGGRDRRSRATPRPGLEPGAYSLGGPGVLRNRGNRGAREGLGTALRRQVDAPAVVVTDPSRAGLVCAFCARAGETCPSLPRSSVQLPGSDSLETGLEPQELLGAMHLRRHRGFWSGGCSALQRRCCGWSATTRSCAFRSRVRVVCGWRGLPQSRRSRLTLLISGGGRRGQDEADRPERSELRSSPLDADGRPELAVRDRSRGGSRLLLASERNSAASGVPAVAVPLPMRRRIVAAQLLLSTDAEARWAPAGLRVW